MNNCGKSNYKYYVVIGPGRGSAYGGILLHSLVVRALQGNKSTVFCTIADFGSAHNFILRRGPRQSDSVAVPEDGFLSNSVGGFVCVPSVIIIKSIHSHGGVHMEDV